MSNISISRLTPCSDFDNSTTNSSNNITLMSLPADVLASYIFSRADLSGLIRIAHTCARFHQIIFGCPQDYNIGKEGKEKLQKTLEKSIEKVKNYIEEIKWLIKTQGFDCIALNEALNDASQQGHAEVVKLLLADSRVDSIDHFYSPIRRASKNGRIEVIEALLADPRVDPSAKKCEAIIMAIVNGHIEIAELLLGDPRVDPSVGNNWAIREASKYGRTEVVKVLLSDSRVDPSDIDNYAIRWASKNGHVEVVQLLLADSRVDPAANDNEAMYKAKANKHTEIVELLQLDLRVFSMLDEG